MPPKQWKRAGKGKKNLRKARPMRTNADRVLAQGVGSLPSRAFGGERTSYTLDCWNAKLPQHLPLPRAVGPYSVVRFTDRISTTQSVMIFGTFKYISPNEHDSWSNVCAIGGVVGGTAINASNNSTAYNYPTSSLGEAVTYCPSALTVQIMNPEALQTTNGIIYCGVMNTQADLGSRTDTYNAWAEKMVQFQAPRLCSAAKLALRGVTANSYPLNMAEISDFKSLSDSVGGTFTWNNGALAPAGFAPIVVYNPSGVALEYLVTVEVRLRFDLDHPASSSHRQHPIATDAMWGNLMNKASALGHGFADIADVIANTGSAVRTVTRALGPAMSLLALE